MTLHTHTASFIFNFISLLLLLVSPVLADEFKYQWVISKNEVKCEKILPRESMNKFLAIFRRKIFVDHEFCLKSDTGYSWYFNPRHLMLECRQYSLANSFLLEKNPQIPDMDSECHKKAQKEDHPFLKPESFQYDLHNAIETFAKDACVSTSSEEHDEKYYHYKEQRDRLINGFINQNFKVLQKYFQDDLQKLYPMQLEHRELLAEYLIEASEVNPQDVDDFLHKLYQEIGKLPKNSNVASYLKRKSNYPKENRMPVALFVSGKAYLPFAHPETEAGGGQNMIYFGIDAESEQKVVIRIPRSDKIHAIHLMDNEYQIFSYLNGHAPYIARPLTMAKYPTMILSILPFYEMGDMAQLLHDKDLLNQEDEELSFAFKLLSGLKYLHDRGIIHRDIKPGNILIDQDQEGNLVPLIHDFGMAYIRHHLQNNPYHYKLSESLMGTGLYMSPDFILRHKNWRRRSNGTLIKVPSDFYTNPMKEEIDKKNDLWALGLTLFQLVTRKEPDFMLSMKNPSQDVLNLTKAQVEASLAEDKLPPKHPLTPIIKDLLKIDYRERPATDEIYQKIFQIMQRRKSLPSVQAAPGFSP